jgi:hypothetical protein
MSLRKRGWAAWTVVLAAACLLVVVAWRESRIRQVTPDPAPKGSVREVAVPSPETKLPGHEAAHQPPASADRIAAWRVTQRLWDGTDLPAFTWPLEESAPLRASLSIPPELLE